MTDHDPSAEHADPDQGHTEEYPTVASGAAAPVESEGGPPFEDDADEWPIKGPARGIRLGVPVAALLAVLLVAAGFWGGAWVQKSQGGSSGATGLGAASGLAARLRAAAGATGTTDTTGGAGASGFPGFGGATGATAGTISVVDGDTLYVITSEGALVKVTLSSSTTVTRNAKSRAIDLRPGDTVVVQGATNPNGDVAASSVSATAPGVSATGGGFGRGFGRGSGGATTTTSGSSGG